MELVLDGCEAVEDQRLGSSFNHRTGWKEVAWATTAATLAAFVCSCLVVFIGLPAHKTLPLHLGRAAQRLEWSEFHAKLSGAEEREAVISDPVKPPSTSTGLGSYLVSLRLFKKIMAYNTSGAHSANEALKLAL
jgi:hypothetical protein